MAPAVRMVVVMERGTVHLEGAHSGNEDSTVGREATVTTFNVHELFCADIRTEAGLRDNKPILSDQLESDLVS